MTDWWLTYPSEKKSVGVMTFPTEWTVIKFHGSSHHQPEMMISSVRKLIRINPVASTWFWVKILSPKWMVSLLEPGRGISFWKWNTVAIYPEKKIPGYQCNHLIQWQLATHTENCTGHIICPHPLVGSMAMAIFDELNPRLKVFSCNLYVYCLESHWDFLGWWYNPLCMPSDN